MILLELWLLRVAAVVKSVWSDSISVEVSTRNELLLTWLSGANVPTSQWKFHAPVIVVAVVVAAACCCCC